MFTLDDLGSLIHHLDLDSRSRLAAKLAYHFYDSYEFLLRLFEVNHSYACSMGFLRYS